MTEVNLPLQIRDLTKTLLASLSEDNQKQVLSKGGKAADTKEKEAGTSKKTEKKGKKKAESDAEGEADASTSATKKKVGRRPRKVGVDADEELEQKKKDTTEEELAEETEKVR